MSYYFSKIIKNKSFQEVRELVTGELQKEGFGIITEINVTNTLKNKLGVDFKNYLILGACNPAFAHKAMLAEDKIGLFLPCNVVIEDDDAGGFEVSVVDPFASMAAVKNEALGALAGEVRQKVMNVIENIK
ncbi:MAG: hypothetical protein A2W91_14280 [Bacteroidetes bacterium GWF2_38_335]|nr:MAG: hypothetical protein A2W91_14280 [Bacteroidetes bacterium GWF2_38_335]OFY79372.1 MAG: hypothetical protein A2281_16875 [Bacteroidetes bacterium RIFOXYA12_FULL_38_20]HBS85633.1 hypothetical protein [Bacteroidales bacterium]